MSIKIEVKNVQVNAEVLNNIVKNKYQQKQFITSCTKVGIEQKVAQKAFDKLKDELKSLPKDFDESTFNIKPVFGDFLQAISEGISEKYNRLEALNTAVSEINNFNLQRFESKEVRRASSERLSNAAILDVKFT